MSNYHRYRRRWPRPAQAQRPPWRRGFDFALMVVFFALVALLAARLNVRPPAESLAGRAYVIDGDTVSIAGNRIRLKGIDAPELAQACGNGQAATGCGHASRQALIGFIGGLDVRCEASGKDKYDRALATCYSGDINLNRAMVEAGQAVAYGDYHDVEASAIRARRGLWAIEFETPQDWRREHEAAANEQAPKSLPGPMDELFAWLGRLLGGLW